MKKFISMVMASAMLLSMAPAPALAAGKDDITAAVTISNAIDVATEKEDISISREEAPELKLKFTKVDKGITETRMEIFLENAVWDISTEAEFEDLISLCDKDGDEYGDYTAAALISDFYISAKKDEIRFVVNRLWEEKDQFLIDLQTVITKTNVGAKALLTVESDDITIKNGADKMFATVMDRGIKASVREIVDVTPEEITGLEKRGILIEDAVAESWNDGDQMILKLNKGFIFRNSPSEITLKGDDGYSYSPEAVEIDEREMLILLPGSGLEGQEKFYVQGIQIEAETAEVGQKAMITITLGDLDKVTLDVAQVIAPRVELKTEDKDIPVFYSGTNVENEGLTDNSDHESLEVTLEETFAGIWSNRKGFTLSLPEGVWVTDVIIEGNEMYGISDEELLRIFKDAYIEGEHKSFVFKKRTFHMTTPGAAEKEEREPQGMSFTLVLAADPDFAGDVTLTLSGEEMTTAKVTIAKFIPPYTVEAEQNDMIIDYRHMEAPSSIIVKEAAADLWEKGTAFTFRVEKLQFDKEADYETDRASELEMEGYEKGELGFTVKGRSYEAAVVTISGIELFLERNIPSGPYELSLHTTMEEHYNNQRIFAEEHKDDGNGCTDDCVVYLKDVNDYSDTVEEKFINIITAGRDQDDATFTTKLVIPVGQKYMTVGDKTLATDTAAYINMDGFTMLPVRAVAVALGISPDSVLWHEDSKTVTILYGQRIITMTAGQKTVSVNGGEIPGATAVEIIGGRTFLGMRDLATALGVTDLTWDNDTKTVVLNGAE